MPEGKENMQEAPPKGIESMQSVSPHNIKSHQSLYLEKILTQKPKEDWKGFNSQIKTWQQQKGYPKLNNSHIKLERNLRIPKDSLRAEWSQEIKEEEPVGNHISKSLE